MKIFLHQTGAVPDYMTVKELSEVMEHRRAEARAAIREHRESCRRVRRARAAYSAASRAYWQGWRQCLALYLARRPMEKGAVS